jgi:hypothetical protein
MQHYTKFPRKFKAIRGAFCFLVNSLGITNLRDCTCLEDQRYLFSKHCRGRIHCQKAEGGGNAGGLSKRKVNLLASWETSSLERNVGVEIVWLCCQALKAHLSQDFNVLHINFSSNAVLFMFT